MVLSGIAGTIVVVVYDTAVSIYRYGTGIYPVDFKNPPRINTRNFFGHRVQDCTWRRAKFTGSLPGMQYDNVRGTRGKMIFEMSNIPLANMIPGT